MVGFIDDDEVPAGGDELGEAALVAGGEGGAAEHELVAGEGVFAGLGGFGFEAAGFIKNAEPEVKAAEELDEPLVDERLGHEDEGATHAADGEEALEDEAGFDSFAEAYFIGEEDAGEGAADDFLGEVKLVMDELETAAEETTHGGGAEAGLMVEGAAAQVEDFGGIGLAGEEAVERAGGEGGVGDKGFRKTLSVGGEVGEQAGGFLGSGDGEGGAVAGSEALAIAEDDAGEHGGADGVEAALTSGRKGDADAAAGDGLDEAETQLGLGGAEATLAGEGR